MYQEGVAGACSGTLLSPKGTKVLAQDCNMNEPWKH